MKDYILPNSENNSVSIKGEAQTSSSFCFQDNKGNDILKLCENGDILVKGRMVENDKEIVNALMEFINTVK